MIAGSAQQLPAELPHDTAAVNADSRVDQVNPSTTDKANAKLDSAAATAAAAEAGGEGANPMGGIMALEDGVQHPLGGPKPDKPKSKRKRDIYNKEAVRVRLLDLFKCTCNTCACTRIRILAAQMWQLYHGCTFTMDAVV